MINLPLLSGVSIEAMQDSEYFGLTVLCFYNWGYLGV
jgi:hypothetical protein